jgi:hypothetical protein
MEPSGFLGGLFESAKTKADKAAKAVTDKLDGRAAWAVNGDKRVQSYRKIITVAAVTNKGLREKAPKVGSSDAKWKDMLLQEAKKRVKENAKALENSSLMEAIAKDWLKEWAAPGKYGSLQAWVDVKLKQIEDDKKDKARDKEDERLYNIRHGD